MPNPYMIAATGSLNLIIRQATSDMGALAAHALVGMTRGANNGVRITAKAIGTEFGDPKDLLTIHERAAVKARSAVVRSFSATRATSVGEYRTGAGRISGGALRAHLATDPNFIRATATGVAFVDQAEMDRKVAHWRRMNFGALGSSVKGRTVESHALYIDQRIVGRIRVTTPPSKPFALPPGRWLSGEGGGKSARVKFSAERRGMDRFYPGGGGRTNLVTRGIKPRNFIDAGLEVLTRELSIGYTNQIDVWLARADAKVKLPPKVVVGVKRGADGRFQSLSG